MRSGLAEFFIIVLGVGVALAADGFRKSFADRHTEREYTTRLVSELRAGRERIVYNQNRVGSALTAIDTLLLAPNHARDTAALVRLAVRAANYEYNPAGILHDQTYRELLATGTLALIRDLPTRSAITTYYRLAYRAAEVTIETHERAREFANLVRAATGEAPSKLVESGYALTPAERARVITQVVSKPNLDDELRLLRSRLSDRSVWIARLLAGTDSLINTLESN